MIIVVIVIITAGLRLPLRQSIVRAGLQHAAERRGSDETRRSDAVYFLVLLLVYLVYFYCFVFFLVVPVWFFLPDCNALPSGEDRLRRDASRRALKERDGGPPDEMQLEKPA